MNPKVMVLVIGLLGWGVCLGQDAIRLDGLSGYGLVPDHPVYDLSGDFTVEAVAVFDSLPSSRQCTIISKLAEWNTRVVGLEYSWPENQRLRFGGRGSGGVEWNVGISNFVPELHRCYHVAGVREGDLFTFYLDGQARDTLTLASVGDVSNAGAWRIGQVLNSIRWFPGMLDEVRVWGHARTAGAIAADAWRSLSGQESGLLGLWSFDEGAGSTFADRSPAGNGGTLTGGFAWTTDPCLIPALTQSFWLHRRMDTFSGLTTGISPGPFSETNRTDRVWIGMHNGDMAWHLRMYQGGQALADQVMDWPGDRWIQVRIERYESGLWRTIWDLGGPTEQVVEATLPGPIPTDPHVWFTPVGYYSNTGGFYLDDLEVSVWDGSTQRVLAENWEDGNWTQCPQWDEYANAAAHFSVSGQSHGGAYALEGFAGLGVSDYTALYAGVWQGPGALMPITDLAISVLPDLSMALTWSPVTQTVCGEPAQPDGYIVYYSEQLGDNAVYFYLDFAYTTDYIHHRAAEFALHTFYQVVPHRGANPALLGATKGMTRTQVLSLISASTR